MLRLVVPDMSALSTIDRVVMPAILRFICASNSGWPRTKYGCENSRCSWSDSARDKPLRSIGVILRKPSANGGNTPGKIRRSRTHVQLANETVQIIVFEELGQDAFAERIRIADVKRESGLKINTIYGRQYINSPHPIRRRVSNLHRPQFSTVSSRTTGSCPLAPFARRSSVGETR